MMAEQLIPIGRVVSVNAARRELRVSPRPGQGHEFENPAWLLVKQQNSDAPLRCRVAACRPAGGQVIVELSAGVPRDTVAQLKHATVVVTPETRTPRPEGAVSAAELPGFRVLDDSGAELGTVATAYETPAHDVMEIEKCGGGVVLVPVIPETIVSVDVERRELVVGDIAPYAVDDDGETGGTGHAD